jgi:hypothetical protein
MDEKRKTEPSKWGKGDKPRRDLTEEAAKKAGYPGALREEKGWYRGARVNRKSA